MLTDAALKQLKSKEKPYKVTDRDGMYAYIAASGSIATFVPRDRALSPRDIRIMAKA